MSAEEGSAVSRILVVDDEPANIQMLAATLQAEGYAVSVATRGEQALTVMGKIRPDLILLDVVMPEMDGFETCRRIKAESEWERIPVIFLTARAETVDVVQGFELGAVDYVAKPFNAHELLARVRTHLTVDELRRTLALRNADLARAHELVRRAFGRYVSEEVAEALLDSPEALELGGEERELTILLSDLRGFTAMAAPMTPQEVISALNTYLEAMVEIVGNWGGTLNEIIGDALLVMFGAPLAHDDHADRAVACALSMQLAMDDVNRKLAEGGWPPMSMGIGVHTGPAVVGNIGSLRRTKYAAVGSTVNIAGRLESFTTGGQILISQQTREHVAAPLTVGRSFQLDPKGASEPLDIHDVVGIGAPFDLSLDVHAHPLRTLPTPIQIRFTILEEKFVGRTEHEGTITAFSDVGATIESAEGVSPLSNLKMLVAEGAAENPRGEIYAKATDTDGTAPAVTQVRFTSLSPELRVWIEATLEEAAQSG